MSSWAERVHKTAADLGNVVTSCGHPGTSAPAYPYRLEKVKFGVPLEEVCKSNNNIPAPLLVLILKLNKDSISRRDVFRAPGHQGAMKKLIHFLQAGRLVNVDNYSVYTIASVLKKFLRKIPNGIFGRNGEMELFAINELQNEAEQTDRLHRLFASLPKYTQHLLVLLFGTFRVIASNAAHAGTGMTSEALGVSVAPSFFQSCVSDGKTARMEDVLKFKVATKIMQNIIDKFATHDIFGRDNYEYYARVTGRILKVQDEWICSFQYPPPPRGKLAQQKYALQHSLEAEKTWLQCQCERWGLLAQEESRSTPALLTSSSSALENSVLSLGVSPEHSFIESCARLSVSLEGPGIFAMTSSPLPKRSGNGTDYDYDEYADDDADVDDEIDGIHGFPADLELSSIQTPHQQQQQQQEQKQHYQQQVRHHMLPQRSNQRYCFSIVQNDDNNDNEDDDDDDDEEDELTIVKRRYRQNKKKPVAASGAQMRGQHQRRLRTGTKSLDGSGERRASNASNTANAAAAIAVASPNAAGGHVGNGKLYKQRTCSRCNRGIRHSSSCSSTSGGAAGAVGGSAANGTANEGAAGGSMTMEELRAVNRYAESTKSLSYLPQVHERQTARMRTRSEWFLGPRDAVVSLQLPADTCSNCCLVAAAAAAGYLGGGSTRDMRQRDNESDSESQALFYHFYRKQQQQQKQLYKQQQPLDMMDMMDTDELQPCQQQQQQQQHHHSQHQQQQQEQQHHLEQPAQQPIHSTKFASGGLLKPPQLQLGQPQQQQQQRRLLLDVNSGSYQAATPTTTTTTATTFTNYFIHQQHNNNNNDNYDDDDVTTRTTTTLTMSNHMPYVYDKHKNNKHTMSGNIKFNRNYNYNYNNNNNNHNNNNNNINININGQQQQQQSEQVEWKPSNQATTQSSLPSSSSLSSLQKQQIQLLQQQQIHHHHHQQQQQQQQHSFYLHEPLNNSCYYSTQCLRSCQDAVAIAAISAAAAAAAAIDEANCDELDNLIVNAQPSVTAAAATQAELPQQLNQQQQQQEQANGAGSSSSNPPGDGSSNSNNNNNNNNFVTVIFNVLDFLF